MAASRVSDLQLLDDDKGLLAAYKATRWCQDIRKNPKLAEQLNALAAKIDTATMTELNKRVDIDQEPVAKVAADFSQASRPDLRGAMNIFQYLHSDWRNILDLTLQHLELVGIAVSLAIAIGVPLGILMVGALALWLLDGLATIVLTLPSIALFGLMIPVFSKFGAGIGPCRPSPPCSCDACCCRSRNTYLALENIEAEIKEAGIGIGMTFAAPAHGGPAAGRAGDPGRRARPW
jgi:ABC-type phosphate/phosphonate transport system permease subunit